MSREKFSYNIKLWLFFLVLTNRSVKKKKIKRDVYLSVNEVFFILFFFCCRIMQKIFPFIHPSANKDNLQFVAPNKRDFLSSLSWVKIIKWLFFFQVVPSAPVMGDTDYSDPFDARLDPRPETAQGPITPENNGYMEPYEAQKVITGQSNFFSFLIWCVYSHTPGECGLPFESYGESEVWVLWVHLSQRDPQTLSVIQCRQTVSHGWFSPGVSQITVLRLCNLFHFFFITSKLLIFAPCTC